MDLLEQYQKQNSETLRTQPSQPVFSSETSKIIQWVMKYSGGLVKNEQQAKYILFVFVALALILSFFLVFGGGSNLNIPLPRGAKIIYPKNEPPRLQEPLPSPR